LIDFENAGFSYGGAPVIRDTTLTLGPDAFHFLVGSSDAGKSTFVRLCYLDLAPTSGRMRFFGRSIRRNDRNAIADLRRAVGVVPQDCGFLDHLPLIDNIALPLAVSGIERHERAADLDALLEWVDLKPRVGALPPELSEGERRRAALARAVILSPEVILADEPTGGVDRETALRLMALLVELSRLGKTVLVATHDPTLVRAVEGKVPLDVLRLAGGRVEPAELEAVGGAW
jgi:cell division transport system ATP-binding protein